jgi:selenocysteine lyase/cysteine desulfurase
MPDPWTALRAEMPVAANWAYFDHAAVAPMSRPALAALREWAEDVANNGDVNWPRWRKQVEDVRRMAAELLNADAAEIALVRNTTEGITLVAEGLRWRPGDNVVVPASEFPSNLYPWLNLRDRGVEVRLAGRPSEAVPALDGLGRTSYAEQLDPNHVAAAVDDRTRIVAVSWVGYLSGWRNDLDELAGIAHDKGALLFVDAIQGLGVFPLDVRQTPVDFLAADGHKWLLGPEGAGVFFVRRELLDELRPLGVGWNSVRHAGEFGRTELDLKDSAGRYEGGSYGMGSIAALGASLELLRSIGTERLSERLIDITNRLCERLEETGAEVLSCRDKGRASGIVSFRLPSRDSQAVRRECRSQGVVVNCRGGAVRLSPHAYTDETDIERLMAVLSTKEGC